MQNRDVTDLRRRLAECQANLAIKHAQISALTGLDMPCGAIFLEIETLCTIVEVLLDDLKAAKLKLTVH